MSSEFVQKYVLGESKDGPFVFSGTNDVYLVSNDPQMNKADCTPKATKIIQNTPPKNMLGVAGALDSTLNFHCATVDSTNTQLNSLTLVDSSPNQLTICKWKWDLIKRFKSFPDYLRHFLPLDDHTLKLIKNMDDPDLIYRAFNDQVSYGFSGIEEGLKLIKASTYEVDTVIGAFYESGQSRIAKLKRKGTTVGSFLDQWIQYYMSDVDEREYFWFDPPNYLWFHDYSNQQHVEFLCTPIQKISELGTPSLVNLKIFLSNACQYMVPEDLDNLIEWVKGGQDPKSTLIGYHSSPTTEEYNKAVITLSEYPKHKKQMTIEAPNFVGKLRVYPIS